MISRLTAVAATFAIFATASLAFAAGSHQSGVSSSVIAAHQPVRVVQLERVVITAKRSHSAD
jgi:hypothetical protein